MRGEGEREGGREAGRTNGQRLKFDKTTLHPSEVAVARLRDKKKTKVGISSWSECVTACASHVWVFFLCVFVCVSVSVRLNTSLAKGRISVCQLSSFSYLMHPCCV